MAVKKFNIKIKDTNATKKKAEMISKLLFTESLSETELDVLAVILDYSSNNSVTLSLDVSKQVKQQAGVSDSSFSTSLYRLEQKGIIIRQGKTIQFHPAFSNIHSVDSFIISFQMEAQGSQIDQNI